MIAASGKEIERGRPVRPLDGLDLDTPHGEPIRANGWSPPYELALQILRGAAPPNAFAPSPPPPRDQDAH